MNLDMADCGFERFLSSGGSAVPGEPLGYVGCTRGAGYYRFGRSPMQRSLPTGATRVSMMFVISSGSELILASPTCRTDAILMRRLIRGRIPSWTLTSEQSESERVFES